MSETVKPEAKIHTGIGRALSPRHIETVHSIFERLLPPGVGFVMRDTPGINFVPPLEFESLDDERLDGHNPAKISEFLTSLVVDGVLNAAAVTQRLGLSRKGSRFNANRRYENTVFDVRVYDVRDRTRTYPSGYTARGEKLAVRRALGLPAESYDVATSTPQHWVRLGKVVGETELLTREIMSDIRREMAQYMDFMPAGPTRL